MRFIFEENQALNLLKGELNTVMSELLSICEPQQIAARVPANTNILSFKADAGFCVLREGMLTASIDDRTLLVFEEGDVVFFQEESLSETLTSALQVQSDFATVCDFYSVSQLEGKADLVGLMLRCLGIQQSFLAQIVALLFKGEKQTNPAIRTVKAGDAIVTEGEISDQVFTLLEGHAQVSVGGELVGEVHADELVGVIGALCGIPRIATVTASKDSLLMSLAKDEFVELLALRPHTVMKLIEDFARIISSSNQELRELKRES